MNQLYSIILFLLFHSLLFSQTKKIEGDTVYWYKWNKAIIDELNLKDFEKSTDDFAFRFRNYGQIVEIIKDSSAIQGTLINYIFHFKNNNRNNGKRLFSKITLTPKQANNAYDIIQNSGILNLPSDNQIEEWTDGTDGITYIIESSDKTTYSFKNYWTPSAQDSIPESLVVLDFVKNLSDTLKLEENYTKFKDDLPHRGCYNSGNIFDFCYASNSLYLGYYGSTKLPIGFYASYNIGYLGKMKLNSGINLQYNFDDNRFYYIDLQAYKSQLFYKKQNLSDYIAYNYQNRKLDLKTPDNKFQNHQIKYGLFLKNNIGISAGMDYLIGHNEKIGGHIYASKWFNKPNISTVFATSIFDNQINYKFGISKSVYFNSRFLIRGFSIGLDYEDFMNYKDLYFNFIITL